MLHEWCVGPEGDGILVDGYAGFIERSLAILSSKTAGSNIDEHEMIVGAAADQTEAVLLQPLCKRFRITDNLCLVILEGGLECLVKTNCFSSDDMHQGTALNTRESL